jgi:unsaturated chondroitin disaccharide hydrolase
MNEQLLASTWERLAGKVDAMMTQIGRRSPHKTEDGIYDDMRIDWWTSGFWPGLLWIMYDMTGELRYRDAAWEWDEQLEGCFVRESNLHHDVGFQFLPTAVMKYKLTGDQDGLRRGLAAANFLAGRFNLAGRFLRAWNQQYTGWSIIDSSMNLSLLLWAAEELSDPRFRHIAVAHADTVVKHFMREDGSVCHIASFDAETGAFVEEIGGQGYDAGSAWSRGQAWALYGLANVYRYTGEERFLLASRRVADYYLSVLPSDSVPPWDFRVPSVDGEPKDTSAAACVASGLLELAALLPDRDKESAGEKYAAAARHSLQALTDRYAAWDRADQQGILLEGTGHKPAGQNVNVSLIYGDYFYVEALAKLKGWKHRVF